MDGFLADHSKREKRPVNDDSQDNYSQQKGKYQLIGIKPFQNYDLIACLFVTVQRSKVQGCLSTHSGALLQLPVCKNRKIGLSL